MLHFKVVLSFFVLLARILCQVTSDGGFALSPLNQLGNQAGFGFNLTSFDRFGTSIAIINDLDSNGFPEVLVGADGDDDGGTNRGAIYLLMMRSDLTVSSFLKISDIIGSLSLSNESQFGSSLLQIADMTQDGIGEIMVGAPALGTSQIPRVITISLNQNGLLSVINTISTGLPGVFIGSGFGAALASLGDFAQDGSAYVAVGAPTADFGGQDTGAVYILRMSGNTTSVISRLDATSGLTLSPGDNFGFSVTQIPDLNGDSIPDLAVGAIRSSISGDTSGALFIIFLNADATLLSFTPISYQIGGFAVARSVNDQFAHSLGTVFGLTAPNSVDLLVGIPERDEGAENQGTLAILNLAANGNVTDFSLISSSVGGLNPSLLQAGARGFISFAQYPDANNNGFTLFFGASGANTPATDAGEILIINLFSCGNGVVESTESCDDGNSENNDGCTRTCSLETGFECVANAQSTSICVTICGDGLVRGSEECDDGNLDNGDSCNSECLSSSPSSALGDGTIAGIVISLFCLAFFCVLAIGCALYAAFLRRRKREPAPSGFQLQSMEKIPVLYDIKILESLGSGNFAEVKKGDWKGVAVALKLLKEGDLEEFVNELKILSELRHPNIIVFYGIFFNESEKYFVTEFMNKGDLSALLHNAADLSTSALFEFGLNSARGMSYLHSNNIIHRDLAARNVLVSEIQGKYQTKIADFGLSRIIEEFYSSSGKRIPVRWTAPEALKMFKFSKQTDVWSFGVVLWEIFSRGAIPYPGLSNQSIVEKVPKGLRLNPPLEAPRVIKEVMWSCWAADPENRPTFDEILGKLETVNDSQFTKSQAYLTRKTESYSPTEPFSFSESNDQQKFSDELINILRHENEELKKEVAELRSRLENQ